MRLIMSRAMLCMDWLASIAPSVPCASGRLRDIAPSASIVCPQ